MKPRFAYITDDVNNLNKRSLFYYLSERHNIKLITTNNEHEAWGKDNVIVLSKNKTINDKIKKILFLISALCNSRFSRLYHKRNLHVRNRFFVNAIHFFKRFLSKFKLLPSYSFIVKKLYRYDSRFDEIINDFDVLIFDSLLINTDSFHSLISRASNFDNVKLVADIYSWDNVHYSTMTYFADYYFIWNEELKKRLINNHPKMETAKIKYVGVQYMNYLQELNPVIFDDAQPYILFAAVYCDEITASVEKKVAIAIADILKSHFPEIKLYFRPYPSMPKDFYLELYSHEFIDVKEFGVIKKRYEGHNEFIRVDNSLQDKINLISNCEAFISLGSTFTFEVAYLMKPIIQLNLRENDFSVIREKVKTADHIISSFLSGGYPNLAMSLPELKDILNDIVNGEVEKYLFFSDYLKGFIQLNKGGNFPVFEKRLMEIAQDES
ncbi:hypothetical protein [Pectobacterium punjabense]|uniref:hypothetical protein n=1 Tax=Pectobacterium punjabense TaxID=2108399 RepID=UPI003D9ABDF5